MKKLVKITILLTTIIALSIVCFLTYFTVTDYRPDAKEDIAIQGKPDTIVVEEPIRIISWNIGYAGLDRKMDFFYDGGTKVRPAKDQTAKNRDGIANYLQKNKDVDFFFLQEIDENAKRSYNINQVEYFGRILPEFQPFYAANYNVQFVPLPLTKPMGKVKSGLATYAAFTPEIAERYAFPFNFNWPLRIFMLDRCFLTLRFPVSNKKELLLINTHNSAFDQDGKIRKAELHFFRQFLLDEYAKGNYVIVGGDFNQSPPGVKPEFEDQPFDFVDFHEIPDTLLPADWKYVYDNAVPSNRRVDIPYNKGETKVTLIDFFIVSPNVMVKFVECDDLEFEFSDHNPVKAEFWLVDNFLPQRH